MSDLNNESSMKTGAAHWYPEDRLVRLDRCRRFLFAEGIITGTVNDAVRKAMVAAQDLQLAAVRDEVIPYILDGPDVPEEPDDGS